MQPDNEDEAWRSIVENYGDRADLDPGGPARQLPRPAPDDDLDDFLHDPVPDPASWQEERFVPPPPPPLPKVPRDRLVAWCGVFGSPLILLFCLILKVQLPTLVGYVLIAGFVGGFIYLVAQMPRGPRDPFDDGARL
ncbi:hypothetical protein [Nocardioides sp.]|uniref:hypothetical protein n=1 Tax=Nocardioides sp. TaxID=35761 RepID=UPI0031FED17D|nr:hypothetical protein [Nocardioides sp.]